LRVAARKRSTFWVRMAAAAAAFVIFSVMVAFMESRVFGGTAMGKPLFATLTWLIFAAALSAGLFFTSDCISSEKREGTLGLLFLTDLRGFDVILGKLAISSLRCIYVLLAILPVLATTLLMGGVTGTEFWRTVLALFSGLLFSLAIGLFVSTLCRDSQKALTATFFLMFAFIAAGPILDRLLAALNLKGSSPILSLSSPGYLFVSAGTWTQAPIGAALCVNQCITWAFLISACLLLPRSWQDKGVRRTAGISGSSPLRRASAALKEKWLDLNPVIWLLFRQRDRPIALLIAILIQVAATVALLFWHQRWAWITWGSLSGLLVLIIYLSVASSAARFFVEGRRSGLIELLLGTPLSVQAIIEGQRRALWRSFAVPIGIWVLAQLISGYVTQREQMAMFTPPPSATTTATTNSSASSTSTVVARRQTTAVGVTVSVPGMNAPSPWLIAILQVANSASFVANVWALAWFGMWMGMSSQSTNMATLRTIAFVQVIPWFAITFLSAFVMPFFVWRRVGGTFSAAWQMLLTSVPTFFVILKDIVLAWMARQRLHEDFRKLTLGVAVSPPPPVVSASPVTVPVSEPPAMAP